MNIPSAKPASKIIKSKADALFARAWSRELIKLWLLKLQLQLEVYRVRRLVITSIPTGTMNYLTTNKAYMIERLKQYHSKTYTTIALQTTSNSLVSTLSAETVKEKTWQIMLSCSWVVLSKCKNFRPLSNRTLTWKILTTSSANAKKTTRMNTKPD